MHKGLQRETSWNKENQKSVDNQNIMHSLKHYETAKNTK
ncbi:hypothetical protein AC79_1611 [Escherichia coli 8-415-05_S4_C1]|nr:hypothetical protein AC79_1611 [Escherichia coli 8-415-05_S4_C1]KEJ13233.1 hypothetical protein AD07_1628 [Escherichia coli 8-415-05_S4_C2]KEJ32889.1 hypothetical protein AD36_1664 [Escherichia coli 8-415-05_S4_C3]KEN33677.1 hypothetical protein AC54_1783 [Escherichia coli 8-415-05_S3_C3]KEN41321.1 hypothetical protein AB96_1814 [Escherichia coli 8-415-05_S3_C1]KEN73680.1 hypothetical protein AC24_1623 [Escherichia coli 8-415-05_S3_C2]